MEAQKFWDRSKEHRGQWETIFKQIDPDVYAFARQHTMKITPWPWDAPEEILSWYSEGVHKNLRLYIEEEPQPYALKLSGSAWVDTSTGDQRNRLGYYEQFEPSRGIPIREPLKALELGAKVTDILEQAFKKVDTWNLSFLKESLGKGAQGAKSVILEPWIGKT